MFNEREMSACVLTPDQEAEILEQAPLQSNRAAVREFGSEVFERHGFKPRAVRRGVRRLKKRHGVARRLRCPVRPQPQHRQKRRCDRCVH